MSTARRGFLSRLGIRRIHCYDEPPVYHQRFDIRINFDDDAASIHTILPAYSPRSNRSLLLNLLPPSPPPFPLAELGAGP